MLFVVLIFESWNKTNSRYTSYHRKNSSPRYQPDLFLHLTKHVFSLLQIYHYDDYTCASKDHDRNHNQCSTGRRSCISKGIDGLQHSSSLDAYQTNSVSSSNIIPCHRRQEMTLLYDYYDRYKDHFCFCYDKPQCTKSIVYNYYSSIVVSIDEDITWV